MLHNEPQKVDDRNEAEVSEIKINDGSVDTR